MGKKIVSMDLAISAEQAKLLGSLKGAADEAQQRYSIAIEATLLANGITAEQGRVLHVAAEGGAPVLRFQQVVEEAEAPAEPPAEQIKDAPNAEAGSH